MTLDIDVGCLGFGIVAAITVVAAAAQFLDISAC